MRLICPNCDAQYEVGDDAIPADGRDVQCSNCGHGWFQLPQEAVAEDVEAAPFGAPEDLSYQKPVAEADPPATEPEQPSAEPEGTGPEVEVSLSVEPDAPTEDEPDDEVDPPPATGLPVQRQAIDESLLAVLREEAELEVAQRQSDVPRPIETQPDLGLEEPDNSAAARLRAAEMQRLAEAAMARDASKSATRRDLLPDIEEINSTLRSSNERSYDEDDALPEVEPANSGGFRAGFVLMMVIAVGLMTAYVMAPKIAAQLPATAPAMQAYVAKVDQSRMLLDRMMQSAIDALTGEGR